MNRKITDYITIVLKGMFMGAADIVPGVSGGTIAFISGIYEEFISSIKNINITAVKFVLKGDLSSLWKYINGNFLFCVFLGIGISVMSLSKLIAYLSEAYPILLWSFFFGLILSSIVIILKEIDKISFSVILCLLVGALLAYYITRVSPTSIPDTYSFLFLSGFIAIIAMILPGISGAFILLLLGSYENIINTVNFLREGIYTFNMELIFSSGSKLVVFWTGCAVGLLIFSKILSWMFKSYRDITLSVLTGFMIGFLNKVWPWKKKVYKGDSHPDNISFSEDLFFPSLNSEDMLIASILIFLLGIVSIILIDRYAKKQNFKPSK
ncbi:DUF368 domain-containing protein [Ichthyobacterium seriolicida]|nr:DUF368 domain-containing protein [Ichthyobacterium seriolicida]